jgi:hypothetical protein
MNRRYENYTQKFTRNFGRDELGDAGRKEDNFNMVRKEMDLVGRYVVLDRVKYWGSCEHSS